MNLFKLILLTTFAAVSLYPTQSSLRTLQNFIHSSNLILYGGNKQSFTSIQNYISQHRIYSQLITSVMTTETAGQQVFKINSFKSAIESCILFFHTEYQTVFLIQPGNLKETKEILKEINSFYKKIPAKSFTIYFFIVWPATTATATATATKLLHNFESLFNNSSIQNEILNILKLCVDKAPIDSHLYILFHEKEQTLKQSKKVLGIWEFYGIYGKYIYEPVEPKTSDCFLQLVRKRNDFQGATVRALVEVSFSLPLLTSFNSIQGKWELRGGISYGFIQSVSKVFNFTLKIVNGTGWIFLDSQKNLNGMGNQLLVNEGDIVISLAEIVFFRIKRLSASHPINEFKVNAYFRQPSPGLHRNIVVEAFSPGLWALIAATWIAIVISLAVITFIKKKGFKNDSDEYFVEDRMIAQDVGIWAVGAACQAGWHYTPKSTSLQIIFLCGLVSSLVYYTAFSASIISIFSIEVKDFQTLTELVRHGFKLYTSDSSLTGHNYVMAQAMKDGETFESRKLNVTPALMKIQDCQIAYVISQEFFFDEAVRENNSHREFCKTLTKLPRYIDRQYNAWYFRKYDPLRKFINWQLTRWKELGLVFRTVMDHARTLPPSCDPKKKKNIPVEIQDVRSAFFILVLGFLLSFCFMSLEIVICRRKIKRCERMWKESVIR